MDTELKLIRKVILLNGKIRKVQYLQILFNHAQKIVRMGNIRHAAGVQDVVRVLQGILWEAVQKEATKVRITLKPKTLQSLQQHIDKALVKTSIKTKPKQLSLLGNPCKNQKESSAEPISQKTEKEHPLPEPELNLPKPESIYVEEKTQPQAPEPDKNPKQPTKPAVEIPSGIEALMLDMADLENTEPSESFVVQNKEVAMFLGQIERKPVHSVVMTLDAPQGTGKTRAAFQFMNAIAESGYKCLFVSLEEHPQSELFKNKRDEYLTPEAIANIKVTGELPQGYDTLNKLTPYFDAIFIDSWGKVAGGKGKMDEFRKSHNGKFMFIIYQRTVAGTMRGGADSQFDADMICKAHKGDNYTENYLYWDKNRYNAEQYIYMIYEKACIEPVSEEV